MATIVTKKLSINEDNIENYCSADNVSFSVSGHAWRKWLNGSTDGYVILKDNGKSELYPTSTAHPFKADSTMSASRSAGTCTVDLQFAGTKVHEESYTSGSQTSKSKQNITDSAVTNSTRATEIKWHVYGKNGDNQRGDLIELTLYFNQYSAQALIGDGANGIQSVSVSNVSPYYGDTITFGIKMVQGATFDGWYSDSACTQLVSAETTYSMAPTADVTLYAKATTDATLYNVSAVAGAEITSVSVSDNIVPENGTATFTAQVNEGCSFEAWYSDDTYTTVASTENPYTATITADTTLYAKAHKNSLNMSVGSAEHGTATVSAATVVWGSDVTFTFTPEDETWELYGWYSDSDLTQLVSEANPYTFAATENVTLYPKVGAKRYKITFGGQSDFLNGTTMNIDAIAVYYDQLTREEKAYLRTGSFHEIDNSKIINGASVQGSNAFKDVLEDIYCPYDAYVSFYAHNVSSLYTTTCFMFRRAQEDYFSYWPYYWYQPTSDGNIYAYGRAIERFCNCSAITNDGIIDAYATTPTYQEREAIFEAELSPGYIFSGWYSDEACTQLVSTDNPANVVTPKYTGDTASQTSLTLYAKATKATYTIGVGTAEHCTASVSAATAQYGDEVTFSCVYSNNYTFYGWYKNLGTDNVEHVSSNNPYHHTVTGDIVLTPVVVLTDYTNDVIHPTNYDKINVLTNFSASNVEYLYENDRTATTYASFVIPTSTEENPIQLGFYVDGSKFSNIPDNAINIKINNIIIAAETTAPPTVYFRDIYSAKRKLVEGNPTYTYLGIRTENYQVHTGKDSIYLFSGGEGLWSISDLKSGTFGVVLEFYNTSSLSKNVKVYNIDIEIGYNIADPSSATPGISLKRNGSWSEAKSVYRKVSDTWVADTDYCKTLLSQKDRIGTFVHIV